MEEWKRKEFSDAEVSAPSPMMGAKLRKIELAVHELLLQGITPSLLVCGPDVFDAIKDSFNAWDAPQSAREMLKLRKVTLMGFVMEVIEVEGRRCEVYGRGRM